MKVSVAPCSLLAVFCIALAKRSHELPVTRVVTLLTELKARIQADETAEQAAFDKYACWCEEITSQKAQSITATRAEIQAGGTQILELRGTVATTVAEVEQLTEDIKKNEEAQAAATSIRQKENAAYIAEKVELEQAVAALEAANTILKEATSGMSLRQKVVDGHSKAKLVSALSSLHSYVSQLPAKARNATQLSALREAARYTPQSLTVQGILQDMYHTFTGNLEQQASDEATAHRNYETLMAEYQSELETMQETLQKKQALKAETERMLAAATQEYADAEAVLKADVDFFDVTKEVCVAKTDAWSERKTLRTRELDGIDKALAILDSDEARALFAKAIKPGYDQSGSTAFLQTGAASRRAPLDKASQALQATARATHSPRISALAATVRAQAKMGGVGHFDQVITAIDALVVVLTEEGKEDQNRADHCTQQYHNITKMKEELQWKITKNEAAMIKLNQLKSKTATEVNETETELLAVQKDIADMGGERTSSNAEYLQGKQDDEQAIVLLKTAKDALAEYYNNHSAPVDSLLKVASGAKRNTTAEPDFRLTDKNKRSTEAKGIVAILQQIIEDLEDELGFSKRTEERAQLDYEARLAAAEALERDLTVKKTNLEGVIAQADLDLEKEGLLLQDNMGEMGNQNQTLADIKPNCDWIIGALAERRSKRETELDGLRQAKEFLAGYRPNLGLVQQHVQRKRSL